MKSHQQDRKVIRYAVTTAMAAALVSGCASSGNLAMADSAKAASVRVDRDLAKSIARAERKVEKAPQDIAARVELATVYLQAGRFESAVTTYEDARFLGDRSARTGLSLALAHVGAGQNMEAVAVLDEYSESIPQSDLGLALALAGDTGRGVSILSDALRAGEDTPKLRQNLAYAYALDGRWREARLMAAQDVPADELDARISEWATKGRPEDFRLRVAALLGVPVTEDMGQPQYLALSRTADEPALALASDDDGELPPVEDAESFWVAEAVKPEAAPVVAPVVKAEVAAAPPAPSDFEEAFAPASPAVDFVSKPVVQPLPVRTAKAVAPVRKSRTVSQSRALVPTLAKSENGTHLVQLGSFASQSSADRAWNVFVSRNPELKNFDKTITQAYVEGKKYWRVSAAGFDKSAARTMCRSVKSRGGGCIPYAEAHPLPGTVSGK